MNPEELARQIDHAAQQSDRWLFLAAIAFICACGIVIIRYLVKQNEKQSERHGLLMEKVLPILQDATNVIREVKDWLQENGGKLGIALCLLWVLPGCGLQVRPTLTYAGRYGDYSVSYDGKGVIAPEIRLHELDRDAHAPATRPNAGTLLSAPATSAGSTFNVQRPTLNAQPGEGLAK